MGIGAPESLEAARAGNPSAPSVPLHVLRERTMIVLGATSMPRHRRLPPGCRPPLLVAEKKGESASDSLPGSTKKASTSPKPLERAADLRELGVP